MSRQLVDVRSEVRVRLDESLPRFWGDAHLDSWINEAARDIARRTKWLQAVRSYDILADQVNYDAPEDMIGFHRAEYRRTGNYVYALEYLDIANLDDIWYWAREVSGSLPYAWTMWGTPGVEGNQIYIFPIPSDTIEDGMRLFYYRFPQTARSDEDMVEVPVGWQDLIPSYVEIHALRRAKDPRWREAEELYEGKLEQMLSQTSWSDQQSRFVSGGPRTPWATPFSGWDWLEPPLGLMNQFGELEL